MTLVSRTQTLMASVPTSCPSTCLFSSGRGSERPEQHQLPLQGSQVFPLSYLPSHALHSLVLQHGIRVFFEKGK